MRGKLSKALMNFASCFVTLVRGYVVARADDAGTRLSHVYYASLGVEAVNGYAG